MTEKLQLLILDLGDSCVVKVEKGEMVNLCGGYHFGSAVCYKMPFEKVRESISALANLNNEKPPYLERNTGGQAEWPYRIICEDLSGSFLTEQDYDALSKLTGHPLPIREPKQSQWTEVVRGGSYEPSTNANVVSIGIWRFTLS